MNTRTFKDRWEFHPCTRCKETLIHDSQHTNICITCEEDLKVHKFLAPFPPEGQKLDEHLFPIPHENVLALTH